MNYLDEFEQWMNHERHYSSRTCRAYMDDVHEWLRFYAEQGNDAAIDSVMTRQFIHELMGRGVNRRSIARKLSSIRSYYGFLVTYHGASTNPFAQVKIKQSPRTLPDVLSEDEVNQLMKLSTEVSISTRALALVHVLLATGLRVSEAAALNWSAIDEAQHTIHVLGKGNKERMVFIHDTALDMLHQYRTSAWNPSSVHAHDAVFLNRQGQRLSARGIELDIEQIGQRLNPPKRLHPHTLRHTFATQLLNRGMDLRSLQLLLGHEELTTTQLYTHISWQHLKTVYDQAHPPVFVSISADKKVDK